MVTPRSMLEGGKAKRRLALVVEVGEGIIEIHATCRKRNFILVDDYLNGYHGFLNLTLFLMLKS